ncbi:riboflavin kinase [Patescibacteria group bacterium]
MSSLDRDIISFKGKVVPGSKKGTELGYPTINMEIGGGVELDFGVYICNVTVKEELYQGAMHYGPKTIGTDDLAKTFCEIHIFRFNEDIYGEEVLVNVLKKIRNVREFDSEQELAEEISRDIKIAKKYFSDAK